MTTTKAPAASTATTSPEARAFLNLAREIQQHLAVLIRNSYLHDLTNEVFEEPLKKTQAALKSAVNTEGSFRLERMGQEFYVNGMRLRMEIRSLQTYKYLWEELNKRELGGFEFQDKRKPDYRGSVHGPHSEHIAQFEIEEIEIEK